MFHCNYLDTRDLNKVIKREHFQQTTFEDISTRLARATHFTKLDAKKRILADTFG